MTSQNKRRAIVIVLDSVGIGEQPDAAEFGDVGSHTLGNIRKVRGKLDIPNMTGIGLAAIENSRLDTLNLTPVGAYGKLGELTKAKDTTCGHWEMAGLPLKQAFKTYPNGFPKELIQEFEAKIGRGTIGNEVASGTEIIQRLGDEHVKTGKPIVYTSADSVFQIAAHEGVIPLPELYRICEIARELLNDDNYLVGRVIARPFEGTSGAYKRTENRKDYAVEPFTDTVLDALDKRGLPVVGIGKIEDIFCHRGVTIVDHTKNNHTGIDATVRYLAEGTGSFIFTNLVDFDMLYGHRNDVEGYAAALELFDAALPRILGAMKEEDILMITADHGCDPTTPSTDHSREYIPLIVAGKHVKANVNLGTRKTFADIGATVFDYLTGEKWNVGESFLKEIYED
ncbi:Phosphopentomutase [bioreactor metagenome]|uniref:Phosphopentomutase n=1 Tax=bioreactor metagenome TaxID=1076179 RepID=A0A645BKY5_9ZZZZ|nr:phosphopentomutase [Christensenella sp.]